MIDRTRRWSAEDDAIIRTHYPDVDTAEVARMLNRSVRALLKRAAAIRVGKSPEFLAAMTQRRAKTLAGRHAEQVEREEMAGPRLEHLPGDGKGIVRVVRHRLL